MHSKIILKFLPLGQLISLVSVLVTSYGCMLQKSNFYLRKYYLTNVTAVLPSYAQSGNFTVIPLRTGWPWRALF